MEPVKAKIGDFEFLVRGCEREEDVRRIAEYVNKKLEEAGNSSGGRSGARVAMLAALNIASDYFQVLQERDEMLAKIRQRTEALIGQIDATIS